MGGGTNPYQGLALPNQVQNAYTSALGASGAGAQAGAGALGQASDIYGRMSGYNPQDVTAGQISNTNLSPYMNPYTQSVIDNTVRGLNTQEQLQQRQIDAQAQDQNAFGGDRFAIQSAANNRNFDETRANTIANLYNQNFGQAQSAAQTDIGNRLNADQGNQSMRSGMLNNAGQGFGSLGSNLAQQGTNDLYKGASQGWGMMQGINANQMNTGSMLQQMQQSLIDAGRNQYSGYTNAPTSGLEYFLKGIGTLPSGIGTTTQTTPKPPKSPLGAIGAMAPMMGGK
jgi:hypothetical protein